MGKQVNLAQDAYEALRAARREEETFSDTVRRLVRAASAKPAIIGSRLHDDPEAELRILEEERSLGAF